MKPKHQRLIFVAVSMIFLLIASVLTLRAFRDNLVFFYSPSELAQHKIGEKQLVRIGGLVETGSLTHDAPHVQFKVTDGKAAVNVDYSGMLPALFREGQGVVVEGYLEKDGDFSATRVLTKHDENYMPKDVVDALKKSGRWQQ